MPALLARAHKLGLTTSADTGHDPAETWQIDGLLEGLDVFLPNDHEAARTLMERTLSGGGAAVKEPVRLCGARSAHGGFRHRLGAHESGARLRDERP